MSKYGKFPGPYFPIFSPNTRKYGPEKTPYLATFPAVNISVNCEILITSISYYFINIEN